MTAVFGYSTKPVRTLGTVNYLNPVILGDLHHREDE